VAYVYVRTPRPSGTSTSSAISSAGGPEAIIVDERHNGGGRSPTTTSTSSAGRSSALGHAHGTDLPDALAAIQGPKAMIIDETAGSGGDLPPAVDVPQAANRPAHRPPHLGRLVGSRFPVLRTRTITAPTSPSDTRSGLGGGERRRAAGHRGRADAGHVIAGRDPQLERAINV